MVFRPDVDFINRVCIQVVVAIIVGRVISRKRIMLSNSCTTGYITDTDRPGLAFASRTWSAV